MTNVLDPMAYLLKAAAQLGGAGCQPAEPTPALAG